MALLDRKWRPSNDVLVSRPKLEKPMALLDTKWRPSYKMLVTRQGKTKIATTFVRQLPELSSFCLKTLEYLIIDYHAMH